MKREIRKNRIVLMPLGLVLCIVPFVVFLHVQEWDLIQYSWFPLWEQSGDLFLYWRGIVFGVLVFLAGISMLVHIRTRQERLVWDKVFFLPLFFTVMTIISFILSSHRKTALTGGYESYENTCVVIAYVLIMWITVQLIRTKEDVKWLMGCLKLGTWVLSVIGILQFMNHDIFAVPAVNRLITGGVSDGVLQFYAADTITNKVYMTFYNSNYAGIYIIMVLPIIALGIETEKKQKKYADLILCLLLMICLIGTGSKTAVIGLAAEVVLYAVCESSRLGWKKAVLLLLSGITFGGLLLGMEHPILSYLRQEESQETAEMWLADFYGTEEGIILEYRGELWRLEPGYDDEGILRPYLYDIQGKKIYLKWYEESQRWGPTSMPGLLMKVSQYYDGSIYVNIKYNQIHLEFRNIGVNGSYVFMSPYGKPDQNIRAENVLSGYESLLNGRGYIWGRVIPLLKEHLLIGSGADTFLYEFPQNDYAMRSNMGPEFYNGLIKDAHSMYLQWMLYYGVVGTVCLIAFLVIQWFRMRKFIKDIPMMLGIWLGVAGYLIGGLTWSSNVSLAPLFWVIFGTGVAMKNKTSVML